MSILQIRLIWAVALSCIAIAQIAAFSSDLLLGVCSLALTALVGGCAISLDASLRLFSPLTVFLISTLGYCCAGPVWVEAVDGWLFYGVDLRPHMLYFILVSACSVIGFVSGWCLTDYKGVASGSAVDVSLERPGIILCVLALVGYCSYLTFSGVGFKDRLGLMPDVEGSGVGTNFGFLLQMLDLGLPGLACLWVTELPRKPRLRLLLSTMLVLMAFSTGFRSNVVKMLVPMIIAGYVRKGLLPRLSYVLSLAAIALVLFSAIAILRTQSAEGFDASVNREEVLESRQMFGDFNVVQASALTLAMIPDRIDYLWGRSVLYLPVHMVPRALFEDKGAAPEMEVVWQITGKEAGFALPMFMLFYLNGGVPLVLIGMLIVGCLLGYCFRLFRRSRNHPEHQVLLICLILVTFVSFPRHSLVQIVTGGAYILTPVLLLIARQRRTVWTPRRQPSFAS